MTPGNQMNRRLFVALGASLSTAAVAGSFEKLCFEDGAENRIFEILRSHLGLPEAQRDFVKRYTQVLKKECFIGDKRESFAAIANETDHLIQFERFIIEDFTANTNFLSFHAGEDAQMKFVTA